MSEYEIGLRDLYVETKDMHSNLRYSLENIEDVVRNIERVVRRIGDVEMVRKEFAYDELPTWEETQ